jgi:hypothetical protein
MIERDGRKEGREEKGEREGKEGQGRRRVYFGGER